PCGQKRLLDRAADVDVAEPVLERALALDQPQLALARFELQLQVAEPHCTRAVEHARALPEDALDGRHELGGYIDERLHPSVSGQVGERLTSTALGRSRSGSPSRARARP